MEIFCRKIGAFKQGRDCCSGGSIGDDRVKSRLILDKTQSNVFPKMTIEKVKHAFESARYRVAFDSLTRRLYATDASIYEIVPLGVAFPENADDVSELIKIANDNSIPITARGAGSGLTGGAIGEGIIVDFSRHFTTISNPDIEKRTVYAGAGVVLDTLNSYLKKYGFCFGPDVATSSRATIGGMIGNDSSGARASYYGTTADHVKSLDVVLADGSLVRINSKADFLRPKSQLIRQFAAKHEDKINEFYLRKHYPEFVKANGSLHGVQAQSVFQKIVKRLPGYDLGRFLKYSEDLSSLICGSEGTLALVVGAELNIVPLPSKKGLCVIFFDSVRDALKATSGIFDLNPVAIENVDRILFDQTRGQPQFKAARDLLELDEKPCEAFLIVEFYNENVEERLRILEGRRLGKRTLVLTDERQMNLVWNLRKAGLSLLSGCKGSAKPATGIEDVAVAPSELSEYFDELDKLLKSRGLNVCYYGHAGAGLLHIRPVLDLRNEEDRKKFREIADEVAVIVRKFKGSIAGEHGVGIARTEYMQGQVGSEILEVMRFVKNTFDPKNILNPGKIVGDGRYKFDTNLRYDRGYNIKLPFEPKLRFGLRDESFVANLEQCNGCGQCRKETPTMCPTFLATKDEAMSTRGRANIIRAALDIRNLKSEAKIGAKELFEVISNCLACKACATECPSNVNMALLKAELLNARNDMEGIPLQAQIFANVDLIGRLGVLMPSVSNALIKNRFVRTLLLKFAGITDKRPLPEFAEVKFRKLLKQRKMDLGIDATSSVILWDDTYVNYFEPEIGISAVEVLERLGYRVLFLKNRKCCGRPAFSQGLLKKAEELGKHNLDLLNRNSGSVEFLTSTGGTVSIPASEVAKMPVIFLEPSCYSMFTDDYFELKLEFAESTAKRCYLFEEFIEMAISSRGSKADWKKVDLKVAVHTHCHIKYRKNTEFIKRVLSQFTDKNVNILNTGCCGMAGAFGATDSKYELSKKVGMLMADVINKESEDTVIVASGTSCRQQIKHLTARKPVHPAEFIARILTGR